MATKKTALDVFKQWIDAKVREDAGKNRDRAGIIDRLNKAVGVAKGSPYCASSVSGAFRESQNDPSFPYTASSQAIKADFKRRGLLFTAPDKLLEVHGAVGGWTNDGDPWHGHVFLVAKRYTIVGPNGKPKVVAIGTMEGNTDGSGSREGDGFHEKRRAFFSDGLWYPVDTRGKIIGPGHALWFCDTSGIKGGSWW